MGSMIQFQWWPYRVVPVGRGLGWVLVGRSGRGVGFAGVEVGGGLAGGLHGCVGADARVGVHSKARSHVS